jgi:hypothetical protein
MNDETANEWPRREDVERANEQMRSNYRIIAGETDRMTRLILIARLVSNRFSPSLHYEILDKSHFVRGRFYSASDETSSLRLRGKLS